METLRNETTVSYRTAYRRTRNGKARMGSSRRRHLRLPAHRTRRLILARQPFAGQWSSRCPLDDTTRIRCSYGAAHYNITGLRPNQVMFGFGDAVSVPVVEWLGKHYFMPALNNTLGKDLYVEQTPLSNHTA